MSQIKIATWADSLTPAPTIDIFLAVTALKNAGKQIFDFGIGELNPEIPIPGPFKQGIIDAVQREDAGYISSAGAPDLLQALSDDFKKNFNLDYTPKQIVICPGPKDALFKACLTILSSTAKRNRSLIFSPTYELFENVPHLITGQSPVIVETDEHFYPNIQQLAEVLKTDDTIGIIFINTPNNPTGAVYPEEVIKQLAEEIGKYPEIPIIFDEVYRTITYDVKHCNIATYLPNQTLVVGGVSKELASTGLRLGYVAGPENIIRAIQKVNGNTTSCVYTPGQRGYARLLQEDGDMHYRNAIRDRLRYKRDKIVALLRASKLCNEYLEFETPQGAFYLFVCVKKLYGKKTPENVVLNDDLEVAKYFLHTGGVCLIPATFFSRPGYMRLCYSGSDATIEGGVQALSGAIEKLK